MDEGPWVKKIKWMKNLDKKIRDPCKNDRCSLGYE
jgi:hypothetical protein